MIRGVMSPSYGRFNDTHLIPFLNKGFDDMRICHVHMSDLSTSIQAVSERTIDMGGAEAGSNEWYYGRRLFNSEVGYSPVGMDARLFCTLCSNGMTATFKNTNSSYRRKHSGRRGQNEELGKIGPEIRFAALLMDENKEYIVDTIQKTHNIPVESPKKVASEFLKGLGFGKNVQTAVKDAWDNEQGKTAYHVMQAITRCPRMVPGLTYEEQLRIEEAGGKYVEKVVR